MILLKLVLLVILNGGSMKVSNTETDPWSIERAQTQSRVPGRSLSYHLLPAFLKLQMPGIEPETVCLTSRCFTTEPRPFRT